MRGVLETSGVPSEVIEVESKAQSTRESVLLLKPVLQKLAARGPAYERLSRVPGLPRVPKGERPAAPPPFRRLKRATRWQKRWVFPGPGHRNNQDRLLRRSRVDLAPFSAAQGRSPRQAREPDPTSPFDLG